MTMTTKDDCEWIFKEYRNKIAGYVSSKICNRVEAEDIVSEIFLKICKNIDKYDAAKASLSTWIYTITRNTVYDRLKSMRNHRFVELDEATPSSENLEESVVFAEMLEKLACALEKLSQKERDLIILLYYKKLDKKSVANLFGITYGMLRYLHDKTIQKLEILLK